MIHHLNKNPRSEKSDQAPLKKKVVINLFDKNGFITSETNSSGRAVITLLLNAFEQSAIYPVSEVICKASIAYI